MDMLVRTMCAAALAVGATANAAESSSDGTGGTSPGAQPQQQMSLVSYYDTNLDGRIDKQEIDLVSDTGVREYILYFDADKDGTIDALETARAETSQAVDRLLAQFDKNDNQVLENSELQHIADQQMKQFVSAYDRNGDQSLSREELIGTPKSQQGGQQGDQGSQPMSGQGSGGQKQKSDQGSAGQQPKSEPSQSGAASSGTAPGAQGRDVDPNETMFEELEPSPESPSGH